MKPRQGLVVTGGLAPPGRVKLREPSEWLVVAADSGTDTAARLDISPDAIVGDMDSLQERELLLNHSADIVTYDSAKDWTDTEIALDYLWKRDVEAVTILGGGGGRIDHLLGIVALFEREPYPRQWFTHREHVLVIDDEIAFDAPAEGVVSFFPVGRDDCEMSSSGLRWELDGRRWKHGDVGISNECQEKRCRVRMVSGRLIMVLPLPNHLVL